MKGNSLIWDSLEKKAGEIRTGSSPMNEVKDIFNV
jgi:hypothetical protein